MLAVCLARLGTFDEAYNRAEEASRLYLLRDPSSSRLSAAHCHLEAANTAILGLRPTKALRPLVRAHSLLQEHHRRSPEWVVLAQLAMQLSQCFGPTAAHDHAVPGFTIGLRASEADGNMEPSAPTLMVGQACAQAGSPFRALHYFDDVATQVDRSATWVGVAIFGLDAAVSVNDMVRAARFCERLVRAHEADPTLKAAPERVPFMHLQISRVVSLASELVSTNEGRAEVESAVNTIQPIGDAQSAVVVLQSALVGLVQSSESDDDSQLEVALVTAIRHGAMKVARDIAWFWCFRYAPGRPISQGDFLKWQWRLLWISLEVGVSAPTFLTAFHTQIYDWWSRLSTSLEEQSFAARIRDALSQESDAAHVLMSVRNLVGQILGSDGGIESLCLAVCEVQGNRILIAGKSGEDLSQQVVIPARLESFAAEAAF